MERFYLGQHMVQWYNRSPFFHLIYMYIYIYINFLFFYYLYYYAYKHKTSYFVEKTLRRELRNMA
jgi:hypothetical protein